MENIDRALIQACIREDRKAQKRLYELCFPELIRICMRYHRQEEFAVEMLNVGFFKILSNLDKYPHEIPFMNWAKRVLVNCLIDNYRRQKRYKSTVYFPDADLNSAVIDARTSINYNEAESKLNAEDIMRMIETLPEVRRQIFLLYAVEGFSHKEISEQFDMAEGTSKWHVSEARKQLRECIMKTMHKTIIRNGSIG